MEIKMSIDFNNSKKITVRLKTLAEIFDIPLNTLRIKASQNKFPGIRRKGRSIYVDLKVFEKWWLAN